LSSKSPQVLNSLWVGDRLGYLEQLCVRSAMETGHHFRLFSYEPEKLQGVPEGVELCHAADAMPREKLVTYSDTGAVALGTNFWRYHLLAKGFGCWVDMDFIFLRPFDFGTDYLFGWEYEGWLNNAVLLAPANSPFVDDLFGLLRPNKRPPWFGPRRSLKFYLDRFRRGYIGLEDMPWGTYSAGLVTYLVKKHGLGSFAQSPDIFYPVRWKDARTLYGPAKEIEAQLTDKTRTVHMWHSRLGELKQKPPPEGSYIHKMCEKYSIDTGRAAPA
jgi:hypothetical protein